MVFNKVTWSQSEEKKINLVNGRPVTLTWEQHEALRRNIEDYQKLIIEYDKSKLDFRKMSESMNRYKLENDSLNSNLVSSTKDLNKKLKNQNSSIEELKTQIVNLNYQLGKSNDDKIKLTNRITYTEKSLYSYKNRYYRELRKNKNADNLEILSIGLGLLVVVLIITNTVYN